MDCSDRRAAFTAHNILTLRTVEDMNENTTAGRQGTSSAEEISAVCSPALDSQDPNGLWLTFFLPQLFDAVKPLITSFIRASEASLPTKGDQKQPGDGGIEPNGLSADPVQRKVVDIHPPKTLEKLMASTLDIPEQGLGQAGIMGVVEQVLKYSVNTWDQGFMDKLYASTNAVSAAGQCDRRSVRD